VLRKTPTLVRAGFVVCALGFCARPVRASGASIMGTRSLAVPDLGELASRRHLVYALVGGTAAWLVYQNEDHNTGVLVGRLDRTVFEPGIDFGNAYGHGAFLAVGTAGLWTLGHFTGSPNAVGAAHDLAKGLVLDGALVYALKVGIDRTRPNGHGYSFPSGHASSAFTVAPILTSRFGWKVGVPAYGVAAFTALGRIEDRKHFPSDVIAGATLGIIVGESIAHHGAKLHMPGHITMGRKGLGLRFKF